MSVPRPSDHAVPSLESRETTGLDSGRPALVKGLFNYNSIPVGYYQHVLETGNPIRRAWHLQKFERVIACLPKIPCQSILDIGCFAGTFLSMLPKEAFSTQLGVDVLEKQIAYAQRRFGTPYRSFRYLTQIADLSRIDQVFDCVTLMEVIEHLTAAEIEELFRQVGAKLKPNGVMVLSTPNYISLWPLLEILVNRLSDVSYEEQHVSKFNYFTCISKLKRLSSIISDDFEQVGKTTTHFMAPFLAAISLKGSMLASRLLPYLAWKNPFGNLILLSFKKRASSAATFVPVSVRTVGGNQRRKAA